jgi:hypothetical protein
MKIIPIKAQYPECENCVNREHDPFQCEECEGGDRFEPYEDEEEMVTEMTYPEFIESLREAA